MDAPRSRLRGIIEALAFSSVLPAAVAGSLTTVASLVFGDVVDPAVIGLAAGGALVVYNVDHLRDLARDRDLAPKRSAFVEGHRTAMLALTGLGVLLSLVGALRVAATAWALCGLVLLLGMFHRRLKQIRGIKTLYLLLSWLAVVLGLPILAESPPAWPGSERFYWVMGTIGCALLANLMASNLDRRRADEQRQFAADRRRLGPAIAVAGLGLGFGIVAPDALRALALVPAAEFAALGRYRDSEAYRALAIDGALLVGAVAALLCGTWSGGLPAPS